MATKKKVTAPNDDVFEALAKTFAGVKGVTVPSGTRGKFGSNSFKVKGRTFAMSIRGELAVKLDEADVAEQTKKGAGVPLSMGKRTMKGWLVVRVPASKRLAFAKRALAYVESL